MTGEGAQPDACPDRETIERCATGGLVGKDVRGHVSRCPACAAQLSEIRRDNDLLTEFVEANTGRLDAPASAPPAVPDGYDIIEEIHRGSQGVVYRARQTATKRVVALKVMLRGTFASDRQRRRFEREVELVASLRHPNIVTVYDGGEAPDGRQFLAMEHIDGRPLDAAAGAATPVPETLELFLKVCDAVRCAHRRGIIHRDLKPDNILVDGAGEPHVLDFGVAKTLDPGGDDSADAPLAALETVAGEFLGTFAYAAPEQVAGDPRLVDTRADVYALGVILYELLTGGRPYALAGSLRDVVRTIVETEPPPPSSARAGLDRDVDTIALTALAKDPDRRYQSVEALRDDLMRYRRGDPIAARQHDAWYLLGKTVRRYRGAIVIGAIVIATLTGFAVTTWSLYVGQKRANYKMAKSVGASLELFGAIDLENPQSPVQVATIPGILANASRIAAEDLADVPDVAAPVRSALGLAYLSLADFDAAKTHLGAALETSRRVHGPTHAEVADGLHNLARFYWKLADYRNAETMYRQALAMREELFGPRDARVARTRQHLASTLQGLGRLEEAERLHRDAIAMREELLGPDHNDVAISANALGSCLHEAGRTEEAVRYYRRALAIATGMAAGEHDWQVARAMHSLASGLIDLGAFDEAKTLLERSMAINRHTRAASDPEIARGVHELARLHLARGEPGIAAPLAQRAMTIRAAAFPDAHPTRISTLSLLGEIDLARGERSAAEARFREALAMARVTYGDGHWRTARIESLLRESVAASG